jgi:hypothetical protein
VGLPAKGRMGVRIATLFLKKELADLCIRREIVNRP